MWRRPSREEPISRGRSREGSLESRASVVRDSDNGSSAADEEGSDGRMAIISGLNSRPDLNGKKGCTVRWVNRKDRWAIIMVDTGEKVLVKDANIECVVPHTPDLPCRALTQMTCFACTRHSAPTHKPVQTCAQVPGPG